MTASEDQAAAASGGAAGPQRIVVVGAGIVGASIGLNLAEQGAQVTVLEAETPGAGTTSTSYAWVNS
ncbi:FAD-binding oxidoreductase, partial [Escherichia coli]|nr:FAD-binding oxidoreductase [Escherichia coli]